MDRLAYMLMRVRVLPCAAATLCRVDCTAILFRMLCGMFLFLVPVHGGTTCIGAL